MVLANTSPTHLPALAVPHVQLLLFQVLNQLREQNSVNGPMAHVASAGSRCREQLQQEERRRRQNTRLCEEEQAQLHLRIANMKHQLLLSEHAYEDLGRNVETRLQNLSKKAELEIDALEKQILQEKGARVICEHQLELSKNFSVLDHVTDELHRLSNGGQEVQQKIDQILAITQQMASDNKNWEENEKLSLETQLKLAKESMENSSAVYSKQNMELETEKSKNVALEKEKAELEAEKENLLKKLIDTVSKASAEQGRFETEIQKMENRIADLQNREAMLQNQKENETKVLAARLAEQTNKLSETLTLLSNTSEKLENTRKELADERKKTAELQNALDENLKNQRDSEKRYVDLMEAERRACSEQLLQQSTALESELQLQKNKLAEMKGLLERCNGQVCLDTKNLTRVIEFANGYQKYVGSGNLKFAVAVFGDPVLKDIFRRSGESITEEDACRNGFACGNGRCIPKCFKCDGINDCGNGNDENECTKNIFPVGTRVVRGADWEWGDQDGEPPGVGTVISEGTNGGWCRVKWDGGHENSYRIGNDGKLDLRVAAGYFCHKREE